MLRIFINCLHTTEKIFLIYNFLILPVKLTTEIAYHESQELSNF